MVLGLNIRCSTKHIQRNGAYLLWGFPHLETLLNRLIRAIEAENKRIEQIRPLETSQNASSGPTLFAVHAPSVEEMVKQEDELRRYTRDDGDQDNSRQPFPSQKTMIGRSDGMTGDRKKKGNDASVQTVPLPLGLGFHISRHAELSRRSPESHDGAST